MEPETKGLRIDHGREQKDSDAVVEQSEHIKTLIERISKESTFKPSQEQIERINKQLKDERVYARKCAKDRILRNIPIAFRVRMMNQPEQAFIDALANGKQILIRGPVHCGKTTLAYAIAYHWFCQEIDRTIGQKKFSYSIYTEMEMLFKYEKLSRLIDEEKNTLWEKERLELGIKSFLMIDDILGENDPALNREYVHIIDTRYRNLLPSIYTTSLDKHQILKIDNRLYSKFENGVIINLQSKNN